jgi:integrase
MTTSAKKRRPKGAGSIVQQKSGTYVFRYRIGGKTCQKSLCTKNRRDAVAAAEDLEVMLGLRDEQKEVALNLIAEHKAFVTSSPLPLGEVWATFSDIGHTAAPGTIALYERALHRFVVWMRERFPNENDFTKIKPTMARQYLDVLRKTGMSASTHNDHRNALGLIASKIASRRDNMTNPFPSGKGARMKADQQERLPLDAGAVQRLLQALDAYAGPYEKEVRCALFLGLFAGCRLVDAVFMKWDSINLRKGVLVYTPVKTRRNSKATATPPILPLLASALDALPRGESEYLMPGLVEHYGRNRDYVIRLLGAFVIQAAGDVKQQIKDQHIRDRRLYGFHSLRHSFAIQMFKAGASSEQLKRFLGDTIQTIDKYYTKSENLNLDSVDGFRLPASPLPRLPTSGAGGTAPDRDELHRLADELALSDVRELLALARRLGGRGLPAAVDALDVEAEA